MTRFKLAIRCPNCRNVVFVFDAFSWNMIRGKECPICGYRFYPANCKIELIPEDQIDWRYAKQI